MAGWLAEPPKWYDAAVTGWRPGGQRTLTGRSGRAKTVVSRKKTCGDENVGGSERTRELKRRRQRAKKLGILKRKAKKASAADKAVIAGKIRSLTPGAEVIIADWKLEDR